MQNTFSNTARTKSRILKCKTTSTLKVCVWAPTRYIIISLCYSYGIVFNVTKIWHYWDGTRFMLHNTEKPIKLFQTERQPTPNFRTVRIRWNHKVDNFCYFWSKLGYSSNASSVGHIIRCCDNWKPVVQVLTYSMCEVVLIHRHVLIQEWQLFLQEHKIFFCPCVSRSQRWLYDFTSEIIICFL